MKIQSGLIDYFKQQWYFKYWISAYLLITAFFFVIFILPHILPPKKVVNGEIGGFILRNQIWEGDIKIVGDTYSFPATKVIVNPGSKITILKENDRFNLVVFPWYLKKEINISKKDRDVEQGEPFWDEQEKVQLRLSQFYANGSGENPIYVTSDSNPGSRYDVNLIKIGGGVLNHVDLSNYRRLEIGKKVVITNSTFKNTGDCAVCIYGGEPLIAGNTFSNSFKFYIDVAEASPIIEKNKFLRSSGDGIRFNGSRFSEIYVNRNLFDMADRKSIVVTQMDEGGEIKENFFNTGIIELPCSSKAKLERNIINVQLVFKSMNICPQEYVLEENFWGLLDIDEIYKARIIGVDDKNKVVIPKILETLPFDSESFLSN